MSKFTPSYWTVDCKMVAPHDTTCILYATAKCRSPEEVCFMSRVFSQAPEMYRLLREVQSWCESHDLAPNIECDIRKVLVCIDGVETDHE